MVIPGGGVDAAQFRQLLGRFATGVTVLTARREVSRTLSRFLMPSFFASSGWTSTTAAGHARFLSLGVLGTLALSPDTEQIIAEAPASGEWAYLRELFTGLAGIVILSTGIEEEPEGKA